MVSLRKRISPGDADESLVAPIALSATVTTIACALGGNLWLCDVFAARCDALLPRGANRGRTDLTVD